MKSYRELIAELSKATLGNYTKKSAASMKQASARSSFYSNRGVTPENQERADYWERRASKRQKGIGRAVDRLTKEEVELDELSQQTLSNYITKAGKQANRNQGTKNQAKREKGVALAKDKWMAKDPAWAAYAAKKKAVKEEAELTELSQKVRHSYAQKASIDSIQRRNSASNDETTARWGTKDPNGAYARNLMAKAAENRRKAKNREQGIKRSYKDVKPSPLIITNHGLPKK